MPSSGSIRMKRRAEKRGSPGAGLRASSVRGVRGQRIVRSVNVNCCNAGNNRRLCAAEGILPLIRDRGEPHGSGLGTVRCVVEHANAWLLANKRLDRRNYRLTIIIDALLTTAC